MTATHIALFRGINVGAAKRVAMADLRAIFEALGFADVRTLLNSGNVTFHARSKVDAEIAARVEAAVADACGFTTRVTVLGVGALGAVIRANPLGSVATDPSRHLVSFVRDPADLKLAQPLARRDWSPDALVLGKRAAYLWCARGVLGSDLWKTFDRTLGERGTARNWTTVTKLHALASAPD